MCQTLSYGAQEIGKEQGKELTVKDVFDGVQVHSDNRFDIYEVSEKDSSKSSDLYVIVNKRNGKKYSYNFDTEVLAEEPAKIKTDTNGEIVLQDTKWLELGDFLQGNPSLRKFFVEEGIFDEEDSE